MRWIEVEESRGREVQKPETRRAKHGFDVWLLDFSALDSSTRILTAKDSRYLLRQVARVSLLDSFAEPDPRPPPERGQTRDIHELARSAVRLRTIPVDYSAVVGHGGNRLGQFAN